MLLKKYLAKIGRSDYTADYYDWEVHLVEDDTVNAMCIPEEKSLYFQEFCQ